MAVRMGCCTGFTMEKERAVIINKREIKNAGFDYIEMPVAPIAALPQEEYQWLWEEVKNGGIPCEAGNILFPGDIKLIGEAVDYDSIDEYCNHAFERAKRLGMETIVFGSGRARYVEEGFSPGKAFDQLVYLLKLVSVIAKPHGITIAVEPLNKKETNCVNTAAEGAALVKAVDCGNVQLLVDYYHMAMEREDMEEAAKGCEGGVTIVHAHIANPNGRVFPTLREDYSEFFRMLRKTGFNGRISVEAREGDISVDAPNALAVINNNVEMFLY